MDLRSWIAADLTSLRDRLVGGVLDIIPAERMTERVDGGGIAPVYVVWHTARHHDLAVNGVLRGTAQILEGWSDRTGVHDDTWRGLAEAEDLDLVPLLPPEAVSGYCVAVIEETLRWVGEADLSALGTIPDATGALDRIGTPQDRFGWLYAMWDGKPAPYFLSWEAIGHGYNHLGELIAVRNRMGLSPF